MEAADLLSKYLRMAIFHITFVPESCTDRKKNQNEKGIDCGGVCPKKCYTKPKKPVPTSMFVNYI